MRKILFIILVLPLSYSSLKHHSKYEYLYIDVHGKKHWMDRNTFDEVTFKKH